MGCQNSKQSENKKPHRKHTNTQSVLRKLDNSVSNINADNNGAGCQSPENHQLQKYLQNMTPSQCSKIRAMSQYQQQQFQNGQPNSDYNLAKKNGPNSKSDFFLNNFNLNQSSSNQKSANNNSNSNNKQQQQYQQQQIQQQQHPGPLKKLVIEIEQSDSSRIGQQKYRSKFSSTSLQFGAGNDSSKKIPSQNNIQKKNSKGIIIKDNMPNQQYQEIPSNMGNIYSGILKKNHQLYQIQIEQTNQLNISQQHEEIQATPQKPDQIVQNPNQNNNNNYNNLLNNIDIILPTIENESQFPNYPQNSQKNIQEKQPENQNQQKLNNNIQIEKINGEINKFSNILHQNFQNEKNELQLKNNKGSDEYSDQQNENVDFREKTGSNQFKYLGYNSKTQREQNHKNMDLNKTRSLTLSA